MALTVKEQLARIDRLIRDKRFPDALSRLEGMQQRRLSGREWGEYCLLRAEAGLYVGTYEIERYVDDAIEIYRNDSDTASFARAKFLKGWLLAALGRLTDARDVLIEAYANFRRCHDDSGSARALNRHAYVSLQLGHTEQAILNLGKCAEIYSRIGDHESQAAVLTNLAYLHYVAGDLQESVEQYRRHHAAILDQGDKSTLIYYAMSALPHARLEDLPTARKSLEKCRPYLEQYPREKAIYFENLGLLELLSGNIEIARDALQSGLDLSLQLAPESALVAQIKRLLGDLYVTAGNFSRAERFAREAMAVADSINERVEVAACRRILASIAQHAGHETEAREKYAQAIDLFKIIGAKYELAATRLQAAASGLYFGGERMALLYLAREYFETEGIRSHVETIDAALRTVAPPGDKSRRSGESPPTVIAGNSRMRKIMSLAEHIAGSEMTVLLTGPTGTGKDLLARYIHHVSGRTGRFVVVNAAAIPNDMVEAELFGHVKGSFTGAASDRPGLIESAAGGTFYLSEVADATPEFQAKLLEVLESREVRRVGENNVRKVNFRLITATNHDLSERMAKNRFRVDLFHRINEITIVLPPLDERLDDIPALTAHFLAELGVINVQGDRLPDLERLQFLLRMQPWSGHVRQLRSRIRSLYQTARGNLAGMVDLLIKGGSESEREQTEWVLQQTGWNRTRAATIMGISEGAVRKRIKKYQLSPE